MRMPSPMSAAQHFAQVPRATIERSQFDRSHGYKSTIFAGFLTPVYVDEALPGDTFALKMAAFGRLATPLKPIMDNLVMDSFFFAVPIRLIWDNWEKFNGAQTNPGDSTSFLVPQIASPGGAWGWGSYSLGDYFGLPVGIGAIETVSALPFRAYNLIWNQWFRDQNMQNSIVVDTDDGPDVAADYTLRKRGKRHDYFTSALPWPQKGTSVSLPLGTTAPVISEGSGIPNFKGDFGAGGYSGNTNLNEMGGASTVGTSSAGVTSQPLKWNLTRLQADLSTATAATINQLRQAFQIQRLLERDARGGTRYTEIVRAHFGVISPDARLQRPEYLGGGSTPILISPVAQTSSTDATTPQANLSGIGTLSVNGHGFVKSFTEHCILLGLVCVRADLTYQQGIERMFSRKTRYDFYWPALSHIGEQAILSKEIYCDGTADDQLVFGYQERYAEYRYKPSRITGLFRSNVSHTNVSIDIWHLAQDFSARPVLGAAFIEESPPMARIMAVPQSPPGIALPDVLFDAFFKLKCARPMPVYGVPGLIDHF